MKNIILIVLALFFFTACNNDDYLVGGEVSSPQVNMTTVDFFESHSQLDTLAFLIKKAGMENLYNEENTTVFAPNNRSIKIYIDKILSDKRKVDPSAEFGLEDIPMDTLTKYMGGFVFEGRIKRENMVEQGEIYTAKNGEERKISLEPVEEYTSQLESFPEYVFFTYKIGADWDAWKANVTDPKEKDDKFRIRTSNIETTNGVVHVIQGNYMLFNYE